MPVHTEPRVFYFEKHLDTAVSAVHDSILLAALHRRHDPADLLIDILDRFNVLVDLGREAVMVPRDVHLLQADSVAVI